MTDLTPRRERLYVAFDDTDTIDADRGTGKVGRWFEDELPDGCRLHAVIRQQLLVHPDVPYTSHNSAAVCIIEVDEPEMLGSAFVDDIVARGVAHLANHWMEGSDPGLCVGWDGCPALPTLVAFGRRAAVEVVTQADAHAAAAGPFGMSGGAPSTRAHLSGHGGTEDGVIGAAAGVGLTADGWNGRFIEYTNPWGHLRDIPEPVSVADLATAGITVVSIDRDAPVPLPDAQVRADGWLRPRLWAGRPVLPVQRDGAGGWFAPGPRTIGQVTGVEDEVHGEGSGGEGAADLTTGEGPANEGAPGV